MKKYILYWMQQSQRARYNKALQAAVKQANLLNLPLIVCFVVTDFPDAQPAHYKFMMQGIRETEQALAKKRTGFILTSGDIGAQVLMLAENAAELFMDRGYLRVQRLWRKRICSQVKCPTKIIDSDTVVPVTVASLKQETAARTIRPRIKVNLEDYFIPPSETVPAISSINHPLVTANITQKEEIYQHYLHKNTAANTVFTGGAASAQDLLDNFIADKLQYYHTLSNDPSCDVRSCLSPYLHFGQISSLDTALQIKAASAPAEAIDAFLEQLIIRRELAINFVWYNPDYDNYEKAVPLWAQKTLSAHAKDKREFLYSYQQLLSAQTHDPYWNAAQNELLKTGFMHNYMRMYWGKKIIEWSDNPQQAYYRMIKLNNTLQLDGRDANSFTGIAWCFGLHDHPWKERPVFGKIRYMNDKGLKRKFKIDKYAEKWNN